MRSALAIVASFVVACGGAGDSLDAASTQPLAPPADDAATPPPAASAPPDSPPSAPPPAPKVLAAPVAMLAAEVAARSPGTDAALAVLDLTSGEYASSNETVTHVSASSPKAIWVAAALDHSGIDAVTPYAGPIFENSDNVAAGSAIDLAGGIDAVNDFYVRAGMTDSAMTQWNGRVATNSPKKMGDDNYFTAKDVIAFLSALDHGTLIAAPLTSQLETWMTWSPRTGYGGWLGTLLPPAAQTSMMHKAGWLPPGCCGDDATYNTLNEIGIVQVPMGHRYAVAILARRGSDWSGKQAPWVERASCVIYRAVSGDASLPCDD
ncbi:MAG TPA: serine hydrolase [Labilithrix sp.]|jgi:beta-lactamase class A